MQQTKNNKAFVDELEGLFFKQLPIELEVLGKAIKERSYTCVYKAAHLLRNSTSIFGIDENVTAVLLDLEAGSREAVDWPVLDELWSRVNDYLRRLIERNHVRSVNAP